MLSRVSRFAPALRSLLPRALATAAIYLCFLEEKVAFTLNGKDVFAHPGATVLDAARANGEFVPTLCHHPRLASAGRCGLCIVEIEGSEFPFQTACTIPVEEGMSVHTNSPPVISKRSAAVRRLANQPHMRPAARFAGEEMADTIDKTMDQDVAIQKSDSIYRDLRMCIGCTRCVRACSDLQGMNILEVNPEETGQPVRMIGEADLADTECISCGQCATFCPTGALNEKDDVDRVIGAMDSGKICVLQTAPAPRVAVSECFDLPPGAIHVNKMVGAAKLAGFVHVFDTNFSADLTIMEEGSELLQRIGEGGPFPMFTSCCPGWINMVEKVYPEFIPNLSTCRSPHMMLAPLIKEYWASKMGISHEDLYVVSLMPCTAKKDDVDRKEMWYKGRPSCDAVLTTREFGRLLKKRGINDWSRVPEVPHDDPLGQSTGAAVLFGVTGGVMEAALRTAYELKTGNPLPTLNFEPCRGLAGVKKFEVILPDGGPTLKFAVANGGKNIRELLKRIKSGEEDLHFVEIMACPSGCIGGGGQPRNHMDKDILEQRMNAVYDVDSACKIRKSHENPSITHLYEDFLEKPLGHKSHELLHTHYFDRRVKEIVPTIQSSGEAGGALILYGSQGGNAAKVARTLEELLDAQTKKGAECMPMDQMSVSDLAKWENVLLVTSTFGVGEFPSNALNFWNDLADDSLPGDMLANTKYSVFGIGSCTYKYYCKAAELLHERFEQLGAESLADCENADTAGPGSHWANFDPWATNVVSALGGSGFSLLEPPTPKYRVSAGLSTSYNEKARLPAPDHHFAPLVKSELVTKEGYPIKRRLFEIDLENTGLSYKTGDHVSIMPRNDPIRVANFLDFYGLPGDMSINIGPLETTQFFSSCQTMDFPPSLTVRELFEQYIDLASGPTRKFMRELALFATNSTERDELLFLADPDNKEAYLNYFANNTLEDTMRRYSSAAPPLDQIVSMAPVIAPRLYSIASAPELVGDKLQLLIALLEWNTPEGTRRTGLTTEYLFRLNAEEKPMVPVSIRKGMLLPPEDPQTPVVMFGLGTGLAPFRGFMQQREAFLSEGKKLGDALLYFGCRNEDGDYVCREEIEGWKKSGALTDVVVGFSHDQKEPIWMDEEIMKQPEVAWRTAKQDGVHMYYCGPAMGIPERLMGAIKHSGQTVGLMNEDAINAWEQRLDTSNPETNRWHVESF